MNRFKVGDKVWIDYSSISLIGSVDINHWLRWFPPQDAPFTITSIHPTGVDLDNGYGAPIEALYNKNSFVKDVIKDL